MTEKTYDQKKAREFEELAKPLIKWLCDNFNPHTEIIITPVDAELLSSEIYFTTHEFIKD